MDSKPRNIERSNKSIDERKGRTLRLHSTRDEREFERLYLESYGVVYGYVRSRMTDEHAAEDIVADAYLSAARAFRSFDPTRAKFSTWVVKIAINCMSNYYRKERPTTNLGDVPESATAEPGCESDVCNRDLADRLLAVLTPEERELVALKYHDGYRNTDIAKALDMNPSTVATKLANARAKMRASLN